MKKHGFADVIVGLDYGDEGKGRITDEQLSTGNYAVAARFNGGNNAGHTITAPGGEKLILNAIPSGVLHEGMVNYIGSGCVVDPVHLRRVEIPRVEKVKKLDGNLKISAWATAITPLHILADRLGDKMIGTTGKGIGPAYAARVKRADGDVIQNLRLGDILANTDQAADLLKKHYMELARRMEHKEQLDYHAISDQILEFIDAVEYLQKRGFIEHDLLWLTDQVEQGQNVLMEGAQAYGLDVGAGIVPFTTSSHTIAGNAYVGGDLSAKFHRKIMGVAKLITSRVGSGPFVGEYGGARSEAYCAEKDEHGRTKFTRDFERDNYDVDSMLRAEDPFKFGIGLRIKTAEYGATTGRPRRLGAIDTYRLGRAARHSGVDELYLTKFDDLQHFKDASLFDGKLPVIGSYAINGNRINYLPINSTELTKVEPVYSHLPLPEDIRHLDKKEQLPENARSFVEIIQHETRAKVVGLGTGPERGQMHYL